MRSVRNPERKIVPTTGARLCNHQSCCHDNSRCKICGRRICSGCTSSRNLETVGIEICLICSGQYRPDEIKLHDD